MKTWSVALCLFIIGICVSPRALAGTQSLPTALAYELNTLLYYSENLHQAMVQQQDEHFEIHIRDLLKQVERVRYYSNLLKHHERGHLLVILSTLKEHLELVGSSYGDERRERLQDAFDQFANIVRIYNVSRLYEIFFCSKDRTSWVQRKNLKARNPFRPEYKECGQRVPHN